MHRKTIFAMFFAMLSMSIATTACGDDDEPARPAQQQGANSGNSTTNDSTTNDSTANDSTANEVAVRPLLSGPCVGGDISMLIRYEQQGAAYVDQSGQPIADLLPFLRQQGWNTMRVRLFVDPTTSVDKAVCQDLSYVVALGRRIKQAGLLFLLDLHYSDTWADPAHQWTPARWLTLSDRQLDDTLYAYTHDCLQQLVAAGATPDFIQTGNEISFGMLWGAEGTADNRCYIDSPEANWTRFIALLRRAAQACREVCPQARIVLHSERVPDAAVLTDFYDRMQAAQMDYDIVGLSYYPYFHGQLPVLDQALRQLEGRNYGKPVMVVETGYPSQWEVPGTTVDCTDVYPYTEQGQAAFAADLVTMLSQHPGVCGLLWWYPEACAKGCNGNLAQGWYNAGLFSNETGRALNALYQLQKMRQTP